jgi:UDPglucose 6-dehydrogenase
LRTPLALHGASTLLAARHPKPVSTQTAPFAQPFPPKDAKASETQIMARIRSKRAKIAVIGMGHVGLPTALGLASLGWQVLGVDCSPELVSRLQAGEATFYEPGLADLLQQHLGKNFLPVQDLEKAIREATILFLCVGTPQKTTGEADLSQLEAAARTIAQNLNSYKLIVEKSTVPAITAQWIQRTIRRYANNENGRKHLDRIEFDVASNPEFLQEGVALDNISRPERIVCGVDSDRAREILEEIYRPLSAPLLMTGLSTAEIIKHAANSFLSMKISFINMVADLCDAIGADVTKVAEGIGMDPRIGPAFLQAGIGFGGYCFPKDLRAFIYLAEEHGVDFSLLKQVEAINERRSELFVKKVRNALWVLHDKTVAALGLSFKPGTDDTRESPSVRIVDRLLSEGAALRLHDPKAMPLLQKVFPPQEGRLTYCDSPYSAAQNAHALLILTDWPEYKLLDWNQLRATMQLPLILDGRNLLDPATVRSAGFEYISIGRPEAPGFQGTASSV